MSQHFKRVKTPYWATEIVVIIKMHIINEGKDSAHIYYTHHNLHYLTVTGNGLTTQDVQLIYTVQY